MAEKFKMLTARQYEMFEVVSALIKSLRRGYAAQAMYWALELETKYWKYLWRRLEIFAVEDIGYVYPEALTFVTSCAEAYARHQKESQKSKPDGNILAAAILMLANAPKNRSVDSFKNYASWLYSQTEDKPLEIPEFALDLHTRRGKSKGRNPIIDWHGRASLVENEQPDEYAAQLFAMHAVNDPELVDGLKQIVAERYSEREKEYNQLIRDLLPVLKKIHPDHRETYSDEEVKQAYDQIFGA